MSNLGDIYDFETILTEASDDLMPVSVASHFNRGDTGVDTYPRINVSLLSKTPNGHMQLNDDGNPFYDQFNCELEVSIKSDKAVTIYTTHTGYVNELRTAYGYNANWNAVLPLTHRVAYVREEASDYSVDGTDNLNITTIRYSMLIVCSLSPFTPSAPTTDNDTIYQVTSSWAVNALTASNLVSSNWYYVNGISVTDKLITSKMESGYGVAAIANYSHAQGYGTEARGTYSRAEGRFTLASGSYSHTEGGDTYTLGYGSHAEGRYSLASGDYSHAEGYTTIAAGNYQLAVGKNNISNTSSLVIIGNGTDLVKSDLARFDVGGVTFTQPLTCSILHGTASIASVAITASYLASTTNAFIQNGNAFGTSSVLGTTDTQNLQFITNNIIRVTVSGSSGYMGVNTANPQHPLSVATNANAQGIQIRRMSSTTGASNEFGLRVASTEGINLAAIRSTRVDENAGHNLQFLTNPTGNNPTIRMTITSLGSVGIGTDAPSASLHVVGDISGSSIGVNSITMYGSSGSLFRLTISEATLGTGSLVITKI